MAQYGVNSPVGVISSSYPPGTTWYPESDGLAVDADIRRDDGIVELGER